MSQPNTVIPREPPSLQKAKTRSAQQIAGIAAALVVGGLLGYLGMKFGRELAGHDAGGKGAGVVVPIALPLIWLFVVALHELGHVAGGWLGGGTFLMYVVGPFLWRRSPAGIRFAWNRNVNLMGGMAACLPLDPAKVTPRRLAVMIAGGPLASLALAVILAWVAAATGGAARQSAGWALVHQLVLAAATLSALIALLTSLPSTAGGFKSDGRRFYELLRGGPRSDQEKALIALTTVALAGVRPANYDPVLVAQSLALRDGSLFDRYAHLTAYAHAADVADFVRAQQYLDYVIAGEGQLAPFIRATARCEYAWLLATQTPDAATARAWLDSAGSLDFDPATRLRAEAAVLLAEGRRAEAATQARAGLHALEHRSLSPARNPFHADALEDLLRKAEA